MKVAHGPFLAHRTTLRLGGRAIAEVVLEHETDLDALPEKLRKLGGTPLVLGQGSNILAADHDLPVVLVRMAVGAQAPRLLQGVAREALVWVPAGMRLPRLLGWLQTQGLSGMEEFTGIPGSLGGAVNMNAGAYGREMASVLQRVLVWSPTQGAVWSEPGRWQTGYRHFDAGVSGSPLIIQGAELLLQRASQGGIQARMRRWYMRRKSNQPLTMATAGCVFKNPAPDKPAGLLLEQAGLRGYRLGDMAFSERHANFLVNLGRGSSEHALELMDMAKRRIRSQFGLELEAEVKVVA